MEVGPEASSGRQASKVAHQLDLHSDPYRRATQPLARFDGFYHARRIRKFSEGEVFDLVL